MRKILAVLALGMGGCGTIMEADRELVYQNKRAGEFIEETADQPEIRQAGRDVKENSAALEKSVGLAKAPKPYSPAASSAARDARDQQHKPKWWQIGLSALGTFILGGGAMRILAGIAPRIFAGPAGAALSAVVTGIANVREAAKAAPDGKMEIGAPDRPGTLLGELAKAQADANVREFVRGMAKKIEKKLGV